MPDVFAPPARARHDALIGVRLCAEDARRLGELAERDHRRVAELARLLLLRAMDEQRNEMPR